MGIFTKALGLDKKGSIAIHLEKKEFFAGETVVGMINVTVTEPIQCSALVLKASGKEKVQWVVKRNNERKNQSKSHTIFEEKVVIASIGGVYQPGTYSYPIEYLLPEDVPGVFSLQDYGGSWVDGTHADITYKLKATLDVNGMLARDIKAVESIEIYQRPQKAAEPSHDSVSRSVRFLCCLSKGTCHLSMSLNQDAYNPGDTATILTEIRNESQVDISTLRCRLYQDVTLRIGWTERPLTQTIVTYEFPGVAAGKTVTHPQNLPLLADDGTVTAASTDGKLIKCSYRIEVECDIPWCPDVVLHLPVTLVEE